MKNFIKKTNFYIAILTFLLLTIDNIQAQVEFKQEVRVFKYKITEESLLQPRALNGQGEIFGGHISIIDNEFVNGKEDKIIFVAHVYGESGPYFATPIGVKFIGKGINGVGEGKWAIVSLDGSPLELNSEFNVLVTDRNHNAFTVSNRMDVGVQIDHPRLNNNPDAVFIINQRVGSSNWGISSNLNPNPVGVYYKKATGYWHIYNTNGEPFRKNAAFNVLVHPGVFKHKVDNTNKDSHVSFITNENVEANSAVFITNSSGRVNTNYKNYFGVWFNPNIKKWTIYNEKKVALDEREAFNILAIQFPITRTTIVKPINLNKNLKVKKSIQKTESSNLKTNNNQLKNNKAAILRLQKNDSTSSSNNSVNKDSQALVQMAMRESYINDISDLKNYAEKLKSFNQKKKSLREKILKEDNEIDANLIMMDYVSELKTFKTELILAISEKLNKKYIASNNKKSKTEMEKEFYIITPLLIKQMTYSYPSYEKANLLSIPRQVPHNGVNSLEDLNSEIAFWTQKFQASDLQERNMNYSKSYLEFQQAMQEENRAFSMISNIMKIKHETARANIKNIKN